MRMPYPVPGPFKSPGWNVWRKGCPCRMFRWLDVFHRMPRLGGGLDEAEYLGNIY